MGGGAVGGVGRLFVFYGFVGVVMGGQWLVVV